MDLQRRRYLISHLSRFQTVRELQRSQFFAQCRGEIEAMLGEAQVAHAGWTEPAERPFIRVAQWNIEKGRRLGRIIEALRSDPVLSAADILLLNEADRGMNRSGNVDVAGAVGDALRMHVVFGAAHIELTKGTGEERCVPGENGESLQGNAVLSRYPVVDAKVVSLPTCFEPFEFHEKRYGTRNCVWARLKVGQRFVWAGSTHLEVRNTPACRARQMAYLLETRPGGAADACILGGDLNCNGFPRGTFLRTLLSTARVVKGPPDAIRGQLRHPENGREPLFGAVRRAGFTWQGLNTSEATASSSIGNLEDAAFLPKPVVEWVRRRLESHEGYLWFKLDWLFGRNIRPADGAALSARSGVRSHDICGPNRISDHAPIWADFLLPADQPPDTGPTPPQLSRADATGRPE